jgi:hypothetical protein
VDFGIANVQEARLTKLTRDGALLGTPAYMAPEQARPGTITAAADIYALATIAFEALSGSLPRWGRTVVAILAQATQEPPSDLCEHRAGTPAPVAEALMRAMSAEPDERQTSASQLLRQLADGFEPDTTENGFVSPPAERSAPPTEHLPIRPRPARKRRARVLAISALTLAAAAVIGVGALLANGSGSRSTPPPPTTRAQARPSAEPTSTPTATPSATPAPRRPRRLSATATIRAFYRRAAAGNYASAWRLAGPSMRRAFGDSLPRFRRELSSLQHIDFTRVAIAARDDAGVTVAIQSVATHADRVDRCSGTLRAIRSEAGGWLVEPAGLRCISG